MTITRVGTNQRYAEGWEQAFAKKKPAAKSAAKKPTAKKSAKKSKR
jgi:hypothetical protein